MPDGFDLCRFTFRAVTDEVVALKTGKVVLALASKIANIKICALQLV